MNHTLNYSGFSDLFFNPDKDDASGSDHSTRTVAPAAGQQPGYATGDTSNPRCTRGLRKRIPDTCS